MANKTSNIVVANLATTEKWFDHFEAECHLDTTGNNRVSVLTALGAWDSVNNRYAQTKLVVFQNATVGTTYYFRFRVIDKGGNAGSWSAWISEVAGDLIAPASTYTAAATAHPGGIVVTVTVTTPATDLDHYEVWWARASSPAPTATTIPNLPNSADSSPAWSIGIGPSDTAYLWIRGVDTSGNRQAWASLGGFTGTGANVFLMNVNTLDNISDGPFFLRSPQFGHAESVENGNFDSGSGATVPGWFANSATITLDSTTTPTTGNSLKVASTVQFGAALSTRLFRATPGEVYKVAGYVLSDGTSRPDIQLMFLNASGTYLGGAQYSPGTGTTWTFGSATGTVPAGATQAQLSLQNNNATGAGVAHFKGVAVYKVRILDDEIADGTTFARHVASDMTGNRIDFSKSLLNKHMGNMPDGGGRYAVINGGGMKAVASVDAANLALIDLSQAGHLNKNVDNIADGTTYSRTYKTFNNYVGASGKLVSSSVLNNQASIASSAGMSTFSYASTTTSVTFTWTAFTVYFPDGSTINVAASTTGTQITISGLSAGTTYHFGAYVDTGGTVHVVLSDTSTSKGSLGWQVQTVNGDGHAVITVDMTAATPASGTGGGGPGGGGGNCFSPNTKVRTHRGKVSIVAVVAGDLVKTKKGTWRPVTQVTVRHYSGPMVNMGDDELSTPTHQVFAGRWMDMRDALPGAPVVEYDGTIHNLHIDALDEDEHSYTLGNGLSVHNYFTL